MNDKLPYLLVYKHYILLTISLLTIFLVGGQELPPILNYPSKVYNAGNQNWSITEGADNNIYIANNDGLLVFNGSKWNKYSLPDNTIMRSVFAVKDTIYSGSYMNFGYWLKDSEGKLYYTSISDSLKIPIVEDEQFWNIESYNQWMLFQSLNRIYLINTATDEIKFISSDYVINKLFNINNTIYFHSLGEGLFKIKNGEKELVNEATIFKENVVTAMFTKENKVGVVFRSGGIHYIENELLIPYNILLNSNLEKYSIYNGIQLADGGFALTTISNGIIIVSENETIKYEINQNNGLSNNTGLNVFEDSSHNLWVALDNGIDCINLKSPFKNYVDQAGRLGTIYESLFYDNTLYLGTNQGLFYKPYLSNEDFRLIKGTEGQVWSLKVIDDVLFCGHDSGTFKIDGGGAAKISSIVGTWDIQKVEGHPELILQGNYNGLHVLEKLDGIWKYRNKVNGFDISSRYFQQVNNNTILVSHEYKGVYAITLDATFRNAKEVVKDLTVEKGANSSLIRFKNNIYYGNENGIFKYNNTSLEFRKDPQLSSIYENDTYISGKLVSNNNETLWAFTNKYIHYITEDDFSNNFQLQKISIPQYLRNEKKGFENITEISVNKYLFGTSSGYFIIDVSQIKDKEYVLSLDRIKNGSTRESIQDISTLEDGIFKTNQNYISFDYSIPEYEKYMEAEYQYLLEGVTNASWSSWSTNTTTAFENLSYGDYTFKVNARVNNKQVENSVQYRFTIQKPWYLSKVAIIIYLVLLSFFFIVVNQFYKRYYRKQRTRILEKNKRMNSLKDLEIQKELIQLKNEKLNIDIEARNRELAVSTMRMIKKNNILSEFKEDLLKLGTDHNVNSLLKKIDNSINDKEDWKFFEEAFNHADKDFFKKIKALHPELTPNDLRLCIYLRLNLSSKEIAPLLNITHRSVEVKRYRIRKKMELAHDVSLTNYILGL